MNRRYYLPGLFVTLLLLVGCSAETSGPTPQLAPPVAGQPLPVAPGVVCRDQLTTPVVVSGKDFSPVPFDLPDDQQTALPEVKLVRSAELDGTPADGLAVTYGGEPGDPNAELLSWQSAQQMTFQLVPSLVQADLALAPLAVGLYDVVLKNANGNEATSALSLAAVAEPELSPLAPGLVCLAQGPRTVQLKGTTLLRLEGRDAALEVAGVAQPFALSSFDGCTPIAHPAIEASTCTSAELVLATDAVPVGYPGVTLQNPETAACASTQAVNLRVVPPPTLLQVEPSLVCTAQGARDVVVSGAGLLTVDGVLPATTLDGTALTVRSADGCEPLETQGNTVTNCGAVTVEVPVEQTAAPRNPTLTVENPQPAGCSSATATDLLLVPPPTLTDVQPPALCENGGSQVLRLTGTTLLVIDGLAPEVRVDGTLLDPGAVTPSGCTPLVAPRRLVELCTTLDVVVDPAMVEGGAATIAVTNPAPAGCSASYGYEVPVVAPPVVSGAHPTLLCTDQADGSLRLEGTDFLKIGERLPEVTLDGVAVVTASAEGCAAFPLGSQMDVERCTGLLLTVPQGTLQAGPVSIGVVNPTPIRCAAVFDGLLVAPPAVVVSTVEPPAVCAANGDLEVALQGDGFLEIAGQGPTVTIGNVLRTVSGLGGCTDLGVPGLAVRSCSLITVQLAAGTLPPGDVPVLVTNPATAEAASCGVQASGVLFGVAVPEITAVAPSEFCTGLGDTVTITGGDFSPVASVRLVDAEGHVEPAGLVTFVSASELQAVFDPGIDPGVYDVVVQNAAGCEDTLVAALEVHPTPLVFFVDPPVAYNGINLQATIYASGLQEEAAEVLLLGPNGEEEELVGASPPGQPNRIAVLLPAGLAPGKWSLRVTSQVGCTGTLLQGLTVTGELTVSVATVDPAFVWTGRSTAVTIKAADPLPVGEVGFVDTPRAYLNPSGAVEGAVATNVRAVLFADAATLTGVVPRGLTPGSFDLIVVNPDATVGLLPGGLEVTADPPPVVTAVVPASFDGNAPFHAVVEGEGFDPVGAALTMLCRQPDGTMSAELPVTVSSRSATQLEGIFPSDQVATGSVCLVIVTNSDGSSFRYSAVSTKTPAQNLNSWVPASSMVEARRGLGLVAGRPTASSRFVYALGGDGGATASAFSSVEASGVDLFGGMGSWSLQRNALPAVRTFAGSAKIGRFIYLTGGDDGTGPVNTVFRSQILDPLATPELVDLSVELLEKEDGLVTGLWIYRVSAVFPADDPANPGGESLPGEPLVVNLPAYEGLALTLVWDRIPGASGYRVYRTPAAGDGVGSLGLLATIDSGDTTRLVDDGGGTVDPTQTPLPPGSLGRWHDTGVTLGTAREAHAVLAVEHPTVAGSYRLFAFGGRGAGGAPLATYEAATVTLLAPVQAKGTEQQTLSPFAPGAATLGTARADLGAALVDADDVDVLAPGEGWIFLGPGQGAAGIETEMDAALLLADGTLAPFVTPKKQATAGAGYGMGDANGFLFMFGGAGGAATSGGVSGELCLGVGLGGCNPDELPEIRNWNNLGTSLSEARVFMGTAQESAFFFVAGGHNGTGATRTVDTTVQ
ncbi:MAG: hypothetical protein RBU45_04195 [Myxococcota bacterium]|nr:hypothetical protein [Myxococcota bacterium]